MKVLISIAVIILYAQQGFSKVNKKQNKVEFKVKSVSGNVFQWSPWSLNWQRVEVGTELYSGSLIVVYDDAKFAYYEIENKKRRTVKINTPLAIRLEKKQIREVKLTPFLVSGGGAGSQAGGGEKGDFSSAWQKGVNVAKSALSKLSLKQTPKEDKFSSTAGAEKKDDIKLIIPRNPNRVKAQQLPARVNLTWKDRVAQSKQYQVSIWKEGEAPVVHGRTLDTNYKLNIGEYGKFFYEISSAKTKGGKPLIGQIVISHEGIKATAASSNIEDESSNSEFFPPSGASFVSMPKPYMMPFVWDKLKKEKGYIYKITVQNEAGKKVFTQESHEPSFSYNFTKSGFYKWQMKVLKQDKSVVGSTAVRNFYINPPEDHIDAQHTGSIFYEFAYL